MKIQDLPRPSLLTVGALGVVGLAAVAAAGFALGMAVGRDPEGARRRVRAVVDDAARAFERASLLAAQARERAGDLWAEARTQAVSEVDEQDFSRAAAAATGAAAAAAGGATDVQAPPTATPRERGRSAPPKAADATLRARARGKPRKKASSSRRPAADQEEGEPSTT